MKPPRRLWRTLPLAAAIGFALLLGGAWLPGRADSGHRRCAVLPGRRRLGLGGFPAHHCETRRPADRSRLCRRPGQRGAIHMARPPAGPDRMPRCHHGHHARGRRPLPVYGRDPAGHCNRVPPHPQHRVDDGGSRVQQHADLHRPRRGEPGVRGPVHRPRRPAVAPDPRRSCGRRVARDCASWASVTTTRTSATTSTARPGGCSPRPVSAPSPSSTSRCSRSTPASVSRWPTWPGRSIRRASSRPW